MESSNLKEINIENCMCYDFDDIIQIEDSNFDNILINERSFKNILVYNISYRTLIYEKPLRIRFDKVDGFIKVIMELGIQYYLEMKNMISFIT